MSRGAASRYEAVTTDGVPARSIPGVGVDSAFARPARSGAPALESAFAEHYPALTRYAQWLVGDRELAADFVQEAFVRLAARWFGVRDMRSYLFQIVTNLARSEWRRRKREPLPLPVVEDGADPAEAVAVRSAVLRLPAKEREVVVLRYYADLDVAEIARVTGRAEGTVKSQLFTARRRLAVALEVCSRD